MIRKKELSLLLYIYIFLLSWCRSTICPSFCPRIETEQSPKGSFNICAHLPSFRDSRPPRNWQIYGWDSNPKNFGAQQALLEGYRQFAGTKKNCRHFKEQPYLGTQKLGILAQLWHRRTDQRRSEPINRRRNTGNNNNETFSWELL